MDIIGKVSYNFLTKASKEMEPKRFLESKFFSIYKTNLRN